MTTTKKYRTDLPFRTIACVTINNVADAERVIAQLKDAADFAWGHLSAREQCQIRTDLAIAEAELAVQQKFAAGELFVAVASFEVSA